MATVITFRGWQRPAIGALVDGVDGGRSVIRTTVEAQGRDADGEVTRTESVRLTALLTGPGDVTGLQRGAVITRFPAPGAIDAETNKCPYVEFADPALPWRYTPRRTPPATDRVLRPWLALLVGTDDEVEVAGDVVTLGATALRAQPISGSPALAHVHESAGSTLARVLSRRQLASGTSYTAVLVPTFVVVDGVLGNAWSSSQQDPVTLPLYASWRFTTGPGGDFRTLATKLEPGFASETTGLAPLRYPRLTAAPLLHVGGALTAVDGPPGEPLPGAVRDDLKGLRAPETDEAGRRIVGLPRYGEAWHEEPDELVWGGTLNPDPRHRGVAGLGLRLGVERQEELAELAAQHAGALDVAAERVRHLTLGLAAAGSLWQRRLPAGPGRRVWLLGPALRRVMTDAGSVEARATADDRPLARGWFSAATRRALRRGPARTALAQPVAADPARLNPAANQAPPPVPFVEAGLPGFDDDAPQFEERRAAVARGVTPPADRMLGGAVSSLNMNRFPRLAAQLASVQARAVSQMEESGPLPWVQLSLLLASDRRGRGRSGFRRGARIPAGSGPRGSLRRRDRRTRGRARSVERPRRPPRGGFAFEASGAGATGRRPGRGVRPDRCRAPPPGGGSSTASRGSARRGRWSRRSRAPGSMCRSGACWPRWSRTGCCPAWASSATIPSSPSAPTRSSWTRSWSASTPGCWRSCAGATCGSPPAARRCGRSGSGPTAPAATGSTTSSASRTGRTPAGSAPRSTGPAT